MPWHPRAALGRLAFQLFDVEGYNICHCSRKEGTLPEGAVGGRACGGGGVKWT
jgi:hypothetical protein